MIPGLIDHLWQSTLFAGAAWLLAYTLRKNRAQVRYWVWFVASVKFLIPFSVIASVGTVLGSLSPVRATAATARMEWVSAWEQVGQPLAIPATAARAVIATETAGRNYAALAIAGLWAVGFVAIAARWRMRWRRVSVLRRSATPLNIQNVSVPAMSVPDLIEPGVFGIFRPVLLLPEGIDERLTAAQLEAIVAHELCHIRRRDNLTAAIHMAGQAVFWFHPLLWWLGARLVEERERACDEEVLRLGSVPQVYAEGILNVCKLYVESPVACVSGVSGSNLRRRIEEIMTNRIAAGLSFARKVALAAAGVAAVALPIAIGMMNALPAQGQQAADAKFDVVSIKPLGPAGAPMPFSGELIHPGGRFIDPGTTLRYLIAMAYDIEDPTLKIIGLPKWAEAAAYAFNAKAGPEYEAVAWSPKQNEENVKAMIRSMLADRFQLKIHREERETKVLILQVKGGGSKLRPVSAPVPPEEGRLIMGLRDRKASFRGEKVTIAHLAGRLSLLMNQRVVDRTGLTGFYDFDESWEASYREGDPAPAATMSPEGLAQLVSVLDQNLGLVLKSETVPADFWVVDQVEMPGEN